MLMKIRSLAVCGALTALLLLTAPFTPPVVGQGYSGAMPNVAAAAGTSLRATYTAGTITYGGATQAITADATGLLTTAAQTDCSSPGYATCNIIYWGGSGTALSTTTTVATAFKPGNVVVAFVTTNGTDITAVIPASRNPAVVPVTYTDGFAAFSPSACAPTFTTTATDSGFPAFLRVAAGQAVYANQTDTTGGTVTIDCDLSSMLSRTTTGGGGVITVTGVNLIYSVVTTTLTSIANPVLKTITGPAAGGAAAGTVADACGTLTYDPSTIQKTAITAGTYYTLNISCGTPLALTSAVRYLGLGLSMVTAGTTKTRFDIGSIVVQYRVTNY
jgi:hypothetical protein